ncbi:MAG TPA: ribonuclease Z [Gemmatimonadaceae bacterium]
MRLITVGTGTAAPHPRRVQSGALVESETVRLLVDCGSGVVNRMAELGLPWPSITHVALTHFHADHTSDLATLIYGWRYGLLPPRAEPVQILGPAGLVARVEAMRAAYGEGLLDAPPPLSLVEISAGASYLLAEGVILESRKVPHSEESVAYSVRGGGRRVVITGDTGYDAALGEWAAGCDVFLCECSLPDSLALPVHLTPRQCGALAAAAAPRLLALTHFYPPVESEPIAEQVAERFSGPVSLCEDGWMVNLEEQ